MTVIELKNEILDALTPVVGVGEATAMMREMFYVLKKYSPADIIVYGNRSVLDASVLLTRNWVRRVVAGEPLQYILGVAHFMGMELMVTPAVLIPRPETSQLVDMITDKYGQRNSLSVLDIGTGSGCIAIALSRALVYADVTAVDISTAALAVARKNATAQHVTVNFVQADALNLQLSGKYDIIVSNPPYIAQSEQRTMDSRVYAHEPAQALFVPDNDPLVFYRAIGLFAIQHLAADGTLFFEINPLFVNELQQMFRAQGWRSVDVLRDYKGNYRFAVCRL